MTCKDTDYSLAWWIRQDYYDNPTTRSLLARQHSRRNASRVYYGGDDSGRGGEQADSL